MHEALFCPIPLDGCAIVTGGVGGLGASIAGALLGAVTGWFVSTAAWLLGLVGSLLVRSTEPPVTSAWFAALERHLFVAAAPIALLALLAGVVHALVRGSMGELCRTVLLRLPVAILLGAAGAGLVGLALSATDQLTATLASGSGTSLRGSLHLLVLASGAEAGVPGAIQILVAGLVIAGSLTLWIELIVRAAAVTIATAVLPLVLASTLWPPAVAWARRLAEVLFALIVSKAVIVLVLTVALDAVANATAGPATALTGGALLLLASFMPYAVLRLVPLVEAAGIGHLESVRHRAASVATRAPRQAVALALAGAGGAAAVPGVDRVGADPIGMLPGIDVDLVAGTALDPDATFTKGPRPVAAVPASMGTHVWERDHLGPRLVWKPPGHVERR